MVNRCFYALGILRIWSRAGGRPDSINLDLIALAPGEGASLHNITENSESQEEKSLPCKKDQASSAEKPSL